LRDLGEERRHLFHLRTEEVIVNELDELKARMAQALEAAKEIETGYMDFEDIIKIQTVCDLLTLED
jgi:hypothetical protein